MRGYKPFDNEDDDNEDQNHYSKPTVHDAYRLYLTAFAFMKTQKQDPDSNLFETNTLEEAGALALAAIDTSTDSPLRTMATFHAHIQSLFSGKETQSG